jgi:hypothetical protein
MTADSGAYRLVAETMPPIRLPAFSEPSDRLPQRQAEPAGLDSFAASPQAENRLPHESYSVSRLWRP